MGTFDSLSNALKSGKISYTGASANNVNIKLGNGDAYVNVKGNNVDIKTGVGNQTVEVQGNDVDVTLDMVEDGATWDFSEDYDSVAVIGNAKQGHANIDMGDGGGVAMAISKDTNIKEGNANANQSQTTIVWGENATITSGDGGKKYDMTLDKATANGGLDIARNRFSETIMDAAENQFTSSLEAGKKERIEHTLEKTETNKTEFMNKVQTKYNLDKTQMNEINKLFESGELFKELRPGVPQYAILQSATQKNADGTPKYVLSKIDSYNDSTGYIHAWGYGYDSNGTKKNVDAFKDCIRTETAGKDNNKMSSLEEYYLEVTRTYNDTYKQDFTVDGMKSYNVSKGKSEYDFTDITVSDAKNTNVVAADSDKHYAKVDSSYTFTSKITEEDVKETDGKVWGVLEQTGTTRQSPLVLDMNRDGKVSATSAYGVDVDGDGKVDGAATNGDKMLAMSDINGNSKIDGAEVFGNKTVSPFSGKALNAANGFEALKALANDAERYTGIKCYENGSVNLASLKAALATVGVNLGYISDQNTTELEALENYDVAAIAVDEYNEVDDKGDVQHRQQGSYTTADGSSYSVDDVWFTNKKLRDI